MHMRKTGALIVASALSGAIMAGATEPLAEAIGRYGVEIGLAFQIVDDILDVEGASAELGKTAGKDAAAGKPTYPALYGLDASRQSGVRLRRSRDRSASRARASAASFPRSRGGSSAEPIEEHRSTGHAARRSRTGRVARTRARADPRRQRPRQRSAGVEGGHGRAR